MDVDRFPEPTGYAHKISCKLVQPFCWSLVTNTVTREFYILDKCATRKPWSSRKTQKRVLQTLTYVVVRNRDRHINPVVNSFIRLTNNLIFMT